MLKLFKRGPEKPPIQSNINDIIRNGTEYFAEDLILLNEPLTGNFYSAEEIVIEEKGQLTGNITGKKCTICGQTTGNIVVSEYLLVKETAIITGDINAPIIDIEPGAIITGNIKTSTDIYAIINLSDKLKKNLIATELPAKVNIAADAIAINPRIDEPVKILAQKANMPKPVAAASATKSTIIEVAPNGSASKSTAPKPASAAANQQPKPASADAADGKWW